MVFGVHFTFGRPPGMNSKRHCILPLCSDMMLLPLLSCKSSYHWYYLQKAVYLAFVHPTIWLAEGYLSCLCTPIYPWGLFFPHSTPGVNFSSPSISWPHVRVFSLGFPIGCFSLDAFRGDASSLFSVSYGFWVLHSIAWLLGSRHLFLDDLSDSAILSSLLLAISTYHSTHHSTHVIWDSLSASRLTII